MERDFQKVSSQSFIFAPRFSSLSVFSLVLAFAGVCFPLQTKAGAATNLQFQNYIIGICAGTITPPSGVVWDATVLSAMCASTGGGAGPPASVSVNLGTADANSAVPSSKNKEVHECLDDLKSKSGNKKDCASGGWGLLLAPQYGRSRRPETELENGFKSDLKGLLVGLDYRFSDSLIVGAAVGHTQDEASFINNAGSLTTRNGTLTLYGTWLPAQKIVLDGYLGYGVLSQDSRRRVVFGTIDSTVSGDTSGRQTLAGISTAYRGQWGRLDFSPFINATYVKTNISAYDETGTTLLELHYGDRAVTSVTTGYGLRLSAAYNFKWGSLAPGLKLMGVHEFQNDATLIRNELVITPGAGIQVATDAPDRDYLLWGVNCVAAISGRTQLFLDYERRSADDFLSGGAVSIGLIKEF